MNFEKGRLLLCVMNALTGSFGKLFFGSPDFIASEIPFWQRTRIFIVLQDGPVRALEFSFKQCTYDPEVASRHCFGRLYLCTASPTNTFQGELGSKIVHGQRIRSTFFPYSCDHRRPTVPINFGYESMSESSVYQGDVCSCGYPHQDSRIRDPEVVFNFRVKVKKQRLRFDLRLRGLRVNRHPLVPFVSHATD